MVVPAPASAAQVRTIGDADIRPTPAYRCLTIASNGKLYAAPCNARRVMVIDPDTQEVYEIGAELPGANKYACLVAADNGKLYAAPNCARRVLEIDPDSSEVQEIGPVIEGDWKYTCMASATNGKLYAVPAGASRVLEIDPMTRKVQEIGRKLRGEEKYISVVAAQNSKLYAVPWCASKFLEIDPSTRHVREFGKEIKGCNKYSCIAAANNGKLYAVPAQASRALEVDPATLDVREIGIALDANQSMVESPLQQYMCMRLAPNGKLYAAPSDAQRVLEIDPVQRQVRHIGTAMEGHELYSCMALAPNGRLYAAPDSSCSVLEINPETGVVQKICMEMDCKSKFWCIEAADNGKLFAAPFCARRALEIQPEDYPFAATPLTQHLKAAAMDSTYVDVEVVADSGERFPAHRLILSRVPFFRALFSGGFLESGRAEVLVREIDADALQSTLDFIYTEDPTAIQASDDLRLLEAVLAAADRFELATLRAVVAERIAGLVRATPVEPAEALRWLQLALRYRLPRLRCCCLRLLENCEPKRVAQDPHFTALLQADTEVHSLVLDKILGKHHRPIEAY